VDQAEQNVARQNGIDVPETAPPLRADGIDVGGNSATTCATRSCCSACANASCSRVKVTEQDIDAYLREQQAGGAIRRAD
jgi:hypothetical protein